MTIDPSSQDTSRSRLSPRGRHTRPLAIGPLLEQDATRRRDIVEEYVAGQEDPAAAVQRDGAERLLLRPRSSDVENLVTARRPRKSRNLAEPTHRRAFASLRVEDADAVLEPESRTPPRQPGLRPVTPSPPRGRALRRASYRRDIRAAAVRSPSGGRLPGPRRWAPSSHRTRPPELRAASRRSTGRGRGSRCRGQ